MNIIANQGAGMTKCNNILRIIVGFMLVVLLPFFFFAQTSQSDQKSVESDIMVKGGEMEPKIFTRRAMEIVGLELPKGEMSSYILQLWVKLNSKIASIPNQVNSHLLYGIYKGEKVKDKIEYTYLVGVEVKDIEKIPEGLSLWKIYPAECVVFFPHGHIGKVVQTYKEMKDWFETSEYEPVDEGYILEIYNTQQDLNENYIVEIWKELKK